MIGIGGSDPVQDPAQTRPADTPNTSHRDPLASHEAHPIPRAAARHDPGRAGGDTEAGALRLDRRQYDSYLTANRSSASRIRSDMVSLPLCPASVRDRLLEGLSRLTKSPTAATPLVRPAPRAPNGPSAGSHAAWSASPEKRRGARRAAPDRPSPDHAVLTVQPQRLVVDNPRRCPRRPRPPEPLHRVTPARSPDLHLWPAAGRS
jgi:hypothetical protein